MRAIQISPEVAGILQASTITENSLKLNGALTRPQYEAVMKVIAAAGGKWNRGLERHVFTVDPRETFAEALGTGKIDDRSERAVRSENQAFYTPAAVAAKVSYAAGIEWHHDVLEPSAGRGALVAQVTESANGSHARWNLIERDPDAHAHLCERFGDLTGGATIIQADFLTLEPCEVGMFDRIVMNPPFTKGQDIEHVTHALKFLRPEGKLVAVMSPGFLHNESKRHQEFRKLMDECGEVIEHLNNGEFKESGTMVSTVIIRLVK